MSDYTPTTEEIRRNNWLGTPLRSSDGIRENAAFNRWLAKHTKEVVEETEQRIIKLLQKEAVFCMLEKHVEDYVALIKGEGRKTNFETYLEEQIKNPEVKEAFEQDEAGTQRVALAWERERFDRLWQLEMDICKCEEAMQHLKVRMGRTQNGIDYDAEFGDNK